jgi:hypothetical protein
MSKSSSSLAVRTSITVLVVLFSALGRAHAAVAAPEIDASVAASGLALLGGVILMVRGRRKQ